MTNINPEQQAIYCSEFSERQIEEENLKSHISYRGTTEKGTADFSSETMRAQKPWKNIFKVLERGTETVNLELYSCIYIKGFFSPKIEAK